jgi:serine/threonine protein kinase
MSNQIEPLAPLFSFDIPEGDAGSARAGLAAGEVIAGWKIVRRIAGGAVSSVYEAVRADEEDGGERKGEDGASKSEADFDGTGGALADKQPVARGGIGTEHGSESRVAIKVFDGERMDESAMRRFRLHATALSGLTHPGLVGVKDWGVDAAGRPYLVMALVEGVTFDAWLASEAGSDGAAIVEVMAGAAEAVGRAHIDMGIVHRDLKPTNVMVDVDGEGRTRARVIDFGIAMVLRGSEARSESLVTRGGAVVGTPAYMAPEQMYAGSRAVDARADVYALGVMIYEALTGSRPVRATDLSLVELSREKERVRVSAGRIRRRARAEGFEVSGATAGVIAAAISPEPEDRQADGAALALDLRRTMRGEVARHRGPGAVRRFRRFLAREPRLGAALIALSATLTLSAAVIGALAIRAERARRAERAQTERLITMVRSWTHGAFLRSFQAPGSEPALFVVTEAVIHALEEACAVRPQDIELSDHLAFAYTQLASVVGEPSARSLGDEARARELHDRSIAAIERSLALYREQRPGAELVARLSLVRAIKRRVSVTPDASERRELMARALAISNEVLARMPSDDQVLLSHAGTLTRWAEEHEEGERRADTYERAAELIGRVSADPAQQQAAGHQRMIIHLSIAGMCASGDTARARRHLSISGAMIEERVGGRTLDPKAAGDAMLGRLQARVQMIDAQIALTEGRWEEADARSAAAIAGTGSIVDADPGNGLSVLDHAVRLRQRAEILLAMPAGAGDEAGDGSARRAEALRLAGEGLALVRGFMSERPRTRHEEEEIAAFERVLADVKE